MRLFIGIAFDGGAKYAVYETIRAIEPVCEGDFTREENLHLTLKFLGEVQAARLPAIRAALQAAAAEARPFLLATSHLGYFKGSGGRTLWLGTEESAALVRLYDNIDRGLAPAGFARDTRPLKAHITLARRAVFGSGLLQDTPAPHIAIPVNEVTLFESVRVQGRLVYRPLFAAGLREEEQ